MYVRLSIPLPEGQTIFRYCAPRDLVARVCDAIPDQDFVRHLLWVTPAKVPRSGLSPFRFTTNQRGRGLEIIALGTAAGADLLTKGHLISGAMAQHFGQNDMVEKRQAGRCSIERSNRLERYYIFRMVIQKYQYEERFAAEEAAHRAGKRSAFLAQHVAQLIERDIVRQAELMLLDVPEDLAVMGVELANFKPHKVVQHRSNLSAQVGFSCNYRLNGPWAVGHLAARGFGIITTNKPANLSK